MQVFATVQFVTCKDFGHPADISLKGHRVENFVYKQLALFVKWIMMEDKFIIMENECIMAAKKNQSKSSVDQSDIRTQHLLQVNLRRDKQIRERTAIQLVSLTASATGPSLYYVTCGRSRRYYILILF
jgi:hypothetical protein